jgi:hypothetical protein
MPGQPVDLQAGPHAVGRRTARSRATAAERGRIVLELVENEFRFFGPAVALRRLARVSCYFAKFMPGFDRFRQALRSVHNLPQFRLLVREHFR